MKYKKKKYDFLKVKDKLFLKKYEYKYLHLFKYLNKFRIKWIKFLIAKHNDNYIWTFKDFFLFNNDFKLNEVFNFIKKEMKIRLKIYKLIYYLYILIIRINELEKYKNSDRNEFNFLKKINNYNFILNKLKNYVLKRKIILNNLKMKENYFFFKWFKILYKKDFLLKKTKNFNKLFLLKFIKNEKKRKINKKKKIKKLFDDIKKK